MKDKAASLTRVKLHKGRTLVKRGGIWYLETCTGGLQLRKSLGTDSIQEATRRAALAEEPSRAFPKPKPAPPLTLGKALEEYAVWFEKTKRSARRALPSVRLFVASVGAEVDTRAVTREHVQRFVTTRSDSLSSATTDGEYRRARAFLKWLATRKEGAITGSPWVAIDRPKDWKTTREAPSPEKVRAVLAKLRSHPWLGDYAAVLAETGMRPSELLGLRGIDVRGKLCSITDWEGRLLKSKWSKRTIELNDHTVGILKARLDKMFDKSRPIFATPTGEVCGEGSAYHAFCYAIGGYRPGKVPEALRMTLYDFRHFFCSEHAAPGPKHMEIEALAAYIGHSPSSTQTLLRWYADARALRRGAPAALVVEEPREGKVIPLGKPKAEGE